MLSNFFIKMFIYPPTIVIRHRRENLKKCSLIGLESRPDFVFFTYPLEKKPELVGYLMLTIDEDVPLLSKKDSNRGLLILDATWRLALKMAQIPELKQIEKRSLPSKFVTAYPRKQNDCPFPQKGLSSLEAIAIAYQILDRDITSLFQNYYWKDQFFFKNADLFRKGI